MMMFVKYKHIVYYWFTVQGLLHRVSCDALWLRSIAVHLDRISAQWGRCTADVAASYRAKYLCTFVEGDSGQMVYPWSGAHIRVVCFH